MWSLVASEVVVDEGDEVSGSFESGEIGFGVVGGDDGVAVGVLDFFVGVEVWVLGVSDGCDFPGGGVFFDDFAELAVECA